MSRASIRAVVISPATKRDRGPKLHSCSSSHSWGHRGSPMDVYDISAEQALHLLSREEGHFIDNKAIDISPAKLTRALSAFANADGGELIVGFDERRAGEFAWRGFARVEDANGHIQHLEERFPYGGDFVYEFLRAAGESGVILRINVLKTRDLR